MNCWKNRKYTRNCTSLAFSSNSSRSVSSICCHFWPQSFEKSPKFIFLPGLSWNYWLLFHTVVFGGARTYLGILLLFRHDKISVRGSSTFRLIGILSWHVFRSEQYARDKWTPGWYPNWSLTKSLTNSRVGLMVGYDGWKNLLGGSLHHNFFFSTSICFLTLYHW